MKFIKADGSRTNAGNVKRAIWYSADCGYWTDDWDKLVLVGPGIPTCPHCQCPGMVIEYDRFVYRAKEFEAEDHPWYAKFALFHHKEKCGGRSVNLMAIYKQWLENKGPRRG